MNRANIKSLILVGRTPSSDHVHQPHDDNNNDHGLSRTKGMLMRSTSSSSDRSLRRRRTNSGLGKAVMENLRRRGSRRTTKNRRVVTPASESTTTKLRRETEDEDEESPEGRNNDEPPKQVRFDETQTVAYEHPEEWYLQTDEVDTMQIRWYNRQELQAFREKLNLLSKTIQDVERPAAHGDAFHTDAFNTDVVDTKNKTGDEQQHDRTYSGVLQTTFEACLRGYVGDDELVQLHYQCHKWCHRVGLERTVVPVVHAETRMRRQTLLHIVHNLPHEQHQQQLALLQQQQQRRSSITSGNSAKVEHTSFNKKYNSNKGSAQMVAAEQLRKACEKVSRPSRLFARYLAQAQL